jgi:integrase
MIDYTPIPGTMHEVYQACLRIDWAGKERTKLQQAKRLLDHMGWNIKPSQIDEQFIDNIVHWLRQEGPRKMGCANGTIINYLSALSIMLKRAKRMKLIEELPMFPEARLLKQPEPTDLVIRDEWVAALLSELKQDHPKERRLVFFLWKTGCRISEALNLTWDRVNEDHIQFVGTKAANPRRVPIPGPVKVVLTAIREEGAPQPFPLSYDAFRAVYTSAVARVCEKLNLDDRTRKEWKIHTLRHTCLTKLAMKGANAPAIMQWAGHKTLTVTQRYVHQASVDLTTLVE